MKEKSIADIFAADLEISSTEEYEHRAVEAHDALSVTMGYRTANQGRFRAHLVKSSPFVTVSFENATPVIRSNTMHILDVQPRIQDGEGKGEVAVEGGSGGEGGSTGVQYIVTLGNYQRWLVYCSEPVALEWGRRHTVRSNSRPQCCNPRGLPTSASV